MGRRPQVTKDQVLTAAREVFSERGFHGASLAAIGSKLGISAAAVLRHAPGKDELFAAAMQPKESDIRIPMEMLPAVDPKEDPRKALRRLAKAFVPFIEERLSTQIMTWMHARTAEDAQRIAGFLRSPFGEVSGPTPPQRALALLEDYFKKATKAGQMKVKDPKAAALLFLAELHAYVTLHRLVRIMDPPMPLNRYLDSLMDIWTRGAFRPGRRKT